MDEIYTNINVGKNVGAVFLDISKAFDRVDFNILLNCLSNCGFRGKVFEWFESYLNGRKMRVRIGDVLSDEVSIVSGVPQGSVLGPILFLIFFNSIFLLKLQGKCIAFADDLSIVYSNKQWECIEEAMNADLRLISGWFQNNNMLLSDKSKCVYFSLGSMYNPNIKYHSNCDGTSCSAFCMEIEHVENFKYLGVHFDRRLSFKLHSDQLSIELRKSLRQFYLLRDYVPLSILKNLYHALVHSRLQYGITGWGGTYVTNLDKAIKSQKSIVRVMCFKSRRSHSFPLFKSLGILPLRYIYIFKALKIFYQRGGYRVLKRPGYSLRQGNTCVVPWPKKELFKRYILFLAPKIFNMLPSSIKRIESKTTFFREVKNWLLEQNDIEYIFRAIGN